jgi:cytochrome b561
VIVQFKNSTQQYGLVSVVNHWLIAILTLGLFFLGIWMLDLDYYDSWYQLAPWWHKGLGVIVFALLLLRFIWAVFNNKPDVLPTINKWQHVSAVAVHHLMNLLILLICISGYLMVTAKGQGLIVFDCFFIPAINLGITNLEDLSGKVHEWLAYGLMGLVLLHVVAALLHHFIIQDATLKRMLGCSENMTD